MAVRLGDEARDTITGFEGVVVGITDWIHGCRRITIQPKGLHDAKIIEAASFDEPAVEVTKPVTPAPPPVEVDDPIPTRRTGGPRPEPTRRADATRRA